MMCSVFVGRKFVSKWLYPKHPVLAWNILVIKGRKGGKKGRRKKRIRGRVDRRKE